MKFAPVDYIKNKAKCYPIICSIFLSSFCFIGSSIIAHVVMFIILNLYDFIVNFESPYAYFVGSILKIAGAIIPKLVMILFVVAFVRFISKINIYCVGNFKETFKVSLIEFIWIVASLILSLIDILEDRNIVIAPAYKIFYEIIQIFIGAFVEESIFRGMVFNFISKKYAKSVAGVWVACISSGAIFGAFHFLNIFSGENPLATIIQIIGAFCIGTFYAAIYFRGKNIWVLIIIHYINNLDALIRVWLTSSDISIIDSMNQDHNISALFPDVPLIILITIFILRKTKIEPLLSNYKKVEP